MYINRAYFGLFGAPGVLESSRIGDMIGDMFELWQASAVDLKAESACPHTSTYMYVRIPTYKYIHTHIHYKSINMNIMYIYI